jgi:hypothetical protein
VIRTIFVGVARLLFNAALLAFVLGGVLIYAAFRLLRAAFAKDQGRPVREAGFAAMVAIVLLVKAIKEAGPPQVASEPETHDDDVAVNPILPLT